MGFGLGKGGLDLYRSSARRLAQNCTGEQSRCGLSASEQTWVRVRARARVRVWAWARVWAWVRVRVTVWVRASHLAERADLG